MSLLKDDHKINSLPLTSHKVNMNTLIIIPPSHYCEKVRRALQLAKLRFTQEAHPPLFHVRAVKRVGGRRTTPTLVTSEGTLDDSCLILEWIQGRPESAWRPYGDVPALVDEIKEWERYFGDHFGPHTRRFAYYQLFKLPKEISLPSIVEGAPLNEQRWTSRLWPIIKLLMKKSMKIDEGGFARSRRKIDACFERVAQAHCGEGYLVGDQLSAADLSFATLAAPLILPKQYGAKLPSLEALPLALQEELIAYREHPAGQLALKIYDEIERRLTEAPPNEQGSLQQM